MKNAFELLLFWLLVCLMAFALGHQTIIVIWHCIKWLQ